MPKLHLYNTLSREKEEFKPIEDNKVGLYTCGPTVYNYAHIGNLRAYLFADTLVRTLRYNSLSVKWVMNITDVDDKTIRDSKIRYPDLPAMEALRKFTQEYEEIFWQDLVKLNIPKPDVITHAASDKYVAKMQELTTTIFQDGYAYIADGSVYFDLTKYTGQHQYGKLVNIDMSAAKAGERVSADEYEKENVQDFVLWKGYKDGEPSWDYELDGQKLPGRPGWHIECSAMAEEELGCPFDIHTGGIDLKFPHHENEISQSVIGYHTEQPVNYWLHNDFVLVDGKRMAKRDKNFYFLQDIIDKDYSPADYRYLTLQTHYRKPFNFTWESLQAAQSGLNNLIKQISELGDEVGTIDPTLKQEFLDSINDDLNLAGALAVLQKALKANLSNPDKLATIIDFDLALGLNLAAQAKTLREAQNGPIPPEIASLLSEREEARNSQNWAKSDTLRAQIEAAGYELKDTAEGQKITPK
ncbi:MAG: cysteine--tRNA ligase [bacterium]